MSKVLCYIMLYYVMLWLKPRTFRAVGGTCSGVIPGTEGTHCAHITNVSAKSCAVHHYLHQSLNRKGRRGTTDDFATSFLHFSLFSTALRDLPNSRPVHSLMLSSHLFLCPPCLLPPFTVPCKMVLARPDERET